MYVALNPSKARQFTTQGIHLTLARPVGRVADDINDECRLKIDQAIRDQVLYVVPDDEANGLIIPGVGSSSGIGQEIESKGDYTVQRDSMNEETIEVKDPFGTVRRMRKVQYTLTLPKEEESKTESNLILPARS